MLTFSTSYCTECCLTITDDVAVRGHLAPNLQLFEVSPNVPIVKHFSGEVPDHIILSPKHAKNGPKNPRLEWAGRPRMISFRFRPMYINDFAISNFSEICLHVYEVQTRVSKGIERDLKLTKKDSEIHIARPQLINRNSREFWDADALVYLGCLMCVCHAGSPQDRLRHVNIHKQSHYYYLSGDVQFIIFLDLISGIEVGCGYECLACNWKASRSYTLDSVQKHMVSKGHCFVRLEGDGLIEYADFYDYSSSYPDADEGEGNPDEEVELNQIGVSEVYQLVLPSGATIGHRSLKRYYRQSLDPNRSAVAVRSNGSMFHKIMSHYRALGYHGSTSQDAVVKHRDIKFMRRMQNKDYMKVGIKANKFQFHFRNQNPM
ncbi:unnamed protein product, partial [Meganyctiphanes norvegica]